MVEAVACVGVNKGVAGREVCLEGVVSVWGVCGGERGLWWCGEAMGWCGEGRQCGGGPGIEVRAEARAAGWAVTHGRRS